VPRSDNLKPSCNDYLEIWEPQSAGTSRPVRPVMGLLYFYLALIIKIIEAS